MGNNKKIKKKKDKILQVAVSSENNMAMPKNFFVRITEGIKNCMLRR